MFSYAIDPGSALALARMRGTLTGEDMTAIVTAVHADPLWEPHFDAIWDCLAVRSHAISPREFGPLMDATVQNRGGRDVLVESRGLAESLFSKLLVFTARAKGEDAHAVHSMDDALRVLGHDALPARLAALALPELG